VEQEPENNLAPNFESYYFMFDYDSEDHLSKGMVQEVYSILNNTNTLTYYVSEDLNDPTNGWENYDTLIMRLGIMNPEVLSYIKAEFYYGTSTKIGESDITLDMFEGDSGSVYVKLPASGNWDQFKVENNARIVFSPVFYDDTDFLAYYYEEGYPYLQAVQWIENDNLDFLPVDLERNIFDTNKEVFVFNSEFEYAYSILEVDNRTERFDDNGVQNAYEITYNNISLPNSYVDNLGNTINMYDGDILFLKYNSTLPEAISLAVGEMVLQRAPYIENYKKGEPRTGSARCYSNIFALCIIINQIFGRCDFLIYLFHGFFIMYNIL
jgi:hypothetical protein